MLPDTLEILQKLVAFPTVSRDSNLPLIDWIRNFLSDCHVESHLVPDSTGTKANLFASVGPSEVGGLVLSGHTDVVPVDGQSWNSDPFKVTSRGSRLHGRGTCDMKGFIAAALAGIPKWQRAGLRRPVHLMVSYDEEVGCLGAPSMIDAAQRILPKPAAVIVGEPTGLRVANQHKGHCRAWTQVTGIEAHSSLTHQGISAVMIAGELIAHLSKMAAALASREPSTANAALFEPPYTTVSVNRIAGGTATNILAGACDFHWDIRPLPDESANDVLDRFTAYAEERLRNLSEQGKQCAIRTLLQAQAPPLQVEQGGYAERLMLEATGTSNRPIPVPFGTEGGQFQRAGWSTVVCGPGSIEQAHKPDEFIERAQLAECERMLDRTVARQCQ